MKKAIIVFAAMALVACSKEEPQQQVYQQPAPVIVQQAPAPAAQPVIVQQNDNSGAMLTGAVLGAMAANAMNNNDRDRGYYDRPARQDNSTNVTHVTVNKTYVNAPLPEKKVAPVEPPMLKAAPAPVPAAPTVPNYSVPNKVTPTLAANPKPLPSIAPTPAPAPAKPSYALQLSKTPVPAPVEPKRQTMTLSMGKAPAPAPAAAPKKVDYGYKAPTSGNSSNISYKQATPSSSTKK